MFLGDKQLYALQNTKKMHLVTQCGGPGRNVEVRDAMWRSGTQCGGLGRNLEVYRNTNF